MKRINLLYVAVPLVFGFILYYTLWEFRQSMTFYGIAETDELDIRLEHPIRIEELFVISGEEVAMGDPLARVSRSDLPGTLNDIQFKIEELQLERDARNLELQADIRQLEAEIRDKQTTILAEITDLKAKAEWDRKLLEKLETIPGSSADAVHPYQARIAGLEAELQTAIAPLEVEIKKLQAELAARQFPLNTQIAKLEKELELVEEEGVQLQLTSPIDGIIGSVNHREGERLPEFNTLLTVYANRPNIIKGYVHENLIVHVEMGDTVKAVSTLDPEKVYIGTVVGLGARIVEIPERLRRITDFKTYGREIIMKIPEANNFLQKEKVYLTLLKTGTPISDRPGKKAPFLRQEITEKK